MTASALTDPLPPAATDVADLDRRFAGLQRLYGEAGYRRVRSARVVVVGLGGVGSWAAEALARSGVASLTLIDLDHVSESNINRQVQALGATIGQAKVLALQARIADIHPGCQVTALEAFVEPDNWPALWPHAVDVLVDACDQVRAKLTLAAWGLASGVPVVCVGAAGGKQQPQRVEVAGLADVTHDPLLASLRQRLRKQLRVQWLASAGVPVEPALQGLHCVFSREPVAPPVSTCEVDIDANPASDTDGSLNCHGYGSSVTVTATFGMVAAAQALDCVLRKTGIPPLPADSAANRS
jgi:tRNA threonylcarbamoyladenosine dehydratase